MILDKLVLVSTLTTIGTSTLIAQVTPLIAQVTPDGPPGLNAVSNLTATGALIFLVVWLTTRTLPAIVKDMREENRLCREERDKERDRVHCQFDKNAPA